MGESSGIIIYNYTYVSRVNLLIDILKEYKDITFDLIVSKDDVETI
jgi:hypothetical protein